MAGAGGTDHGDQIADRRRFLLPLGNMGEPDRLVAWLEWDAVGRLVRFRVRQEAPADGGVGFSTVLEVRYDGSRHVLQRFTRSGEPAGEAEDWPGADPEGAASDVRGLYEHCSGTITLEWKQNKARWT